jgi:ethanolamine utilization protein EutL
MAINDRLGSSVLAVKIIPNVQKEMLQSIVAATTIPNFKMRDDIKSIGLVTTDCDDVCYTALDECTKKADVMVLYARSCYAGAGNASTKLAGEIIGIIGGPNPAEVRSGLNVLCQFVAEEASFYSATEETDYAKVVPYYAHCISRSGSYLSKIAGINEGEAIAYLIAPPLEAIYGMDQALKAADVRMAAFYGPPSETNFGGGLLTGSQSACKAACDAFADSVKFIAANPTAY